MSLLSQVFVPQGLWPGPVVVMWLWDTSARASGNLSLSHWGALGTEGPAEKSLDTGFGAGRVQYTLRGDTTPGRGDGKLGFALLGLPTGTPPSGEPVHFFWL